jgi:hypothetical protein
MVRRAAQDYAAMLRKQAICGEPPRHSVRWQTGLIFQAAKR